jgi:hypothetical protein
LSAEQHGSAGTRATSTDWRKYLARKRKTEEQLAEADMLDTLRTVVRLKHRIEVRHELNELEAAAIEQQQDAIDAGQPFKLDIAKLLRRELESGE